MNFGCPAGSQNDAKIENVGGLPRDSPSLGPSMRPKGYLWWLRACLDPPRRLKLIEIQPPRDLKLHGSLDAKFLVIFPMRVARAVVLAAVAGTL